MKHCKVCGSRLSLKAGENCIPCRDWASRIYQKVRAMKAAEELFRGVVTSLGGFYHS